MAEQAKVEVKSEPARAETPAPAAKPVEAKVETPAAPVIAKVAEPKPAAPKLAKADVKAAAKAKPKAMKKKIAAKPAKPVVAATPEASTRKLPFVKAVAAKVAAPVATPFKQIKDRTITMNDTIKKQAETAMNQGKAAVEQFQVKAKEAMEQGTKSMEEMNSFARGNVEAMVEAGRVAAKGMETMTQHVVEMAKKNAEATTTAVRSFAGAKNANELIQLQSDFARMQFDKFVADSSKMTEMFVKLAGEAFEPISNRFAVAADRFAKAGAR
jgi:phasin family protein